MKSRSRPSFGPFLAEMFIIVLALPAIAQSTNRLQVLPNRENVLTLSSGTNAFYEIQVSSNCVDWNALATVWCTNVSIQHTDSAAPFLSYRFYRARQLTNSSVVPGDHIQTSSGDIVIGKGYHASFPIKWNNLMIYVDPTNTFAGLPRGDLILLTHNHNDHFNPTVITAVKGPTAVIIAPQSVYSQSSFAGLRSITGVLSNGFSTNLLGINIEAVPMYNGNHPPGQGNGYILTLGDKRVYVSGDSGDTSEMRGLQNIDVAFLPMNQYTLSVTQAVNAVRGFVPRIVYPEHYRTNSAGGISDLGSFKTQVMTNPGVEVRLRNWY